MIRWPFKMSRPSKNPVLPRTGDNFDGPCGQVVDRDFDGMQRRRIELARRLRRLRSPPLRKVERIGQRFGQSVRVRGRVDLGRKIALRLAGDWIADRDVNERGRRLDLLLITIPNHTSPPASRISRRTPDRDIGRVSSPTRPMWTSTLPTLASTRIAKASRSRSESIMRSS